LINQSLGVALLIIPLIAFVTCTVNVVTWALIKLVADHLIEGKKHEKELPGEIEEVKPKTKRRRQPRNPPQRKRNEQDPMKIGFFDAWEKVEVMI